MRQMCPGLGNSIILSVPDRIMEEKERELASPLSQTEHIELLVNRCMIFTKKNYEYDYHPYDDTYIEQKTTP
ncbi:MAG TPA: hypothetical protein VH593_03270 [Ktedonobacteraceae bacterium]